MSRKGLNIYKRRDGRWEGRYVKFREARRTRFGYVFGKTYQETKLKLFEARSTWKIREKAETDAELTVQETGRLWLKDFAGLLKESSEVRYRNYLDCYILPELGEEVLSGITDAKVSAFGTSLLLHGGIKEQGLSPKTVSEVIKILKSIRKYALNRGYTVGFSADCYTVHQEKSLPRVFDPEEQERLRRYLQENDTLTNRGILFCLYTGLRIGEICALKWDDIAKDGSEVRIHSTMQRIKDESGGSRKTKISITTPKSICSVRRIPLPDCIRASLLKERKQGAYFLTGERNRFVEPRTLQNHFSTVIKLCGIQNASFHVLRHTFATNCIEAGFDPKALSELLGHADVSITLNRYVHPSMEMKKLYMAKLK